MLPDDPLGKDRMAASRSDGTIVRLVVSRTGTCLRSTGAAGCLSSNACYVSSQLTAGVSSDHNNRAAARTFPVSSLAATAAPRTSSRDFLQGPFLMSGSVGTHFPVSNKDIRFFTRVTIFTRFPPREGFSKIA